MFIVIYTDRESHYEPPWDRYDKGGTTIVDVPKYMFLNTLKDLEAFMQKLLTSNNNYKNVKYFRIDREIFPVLKVQVDVDIGESPPIVASKVSN